MSYNESNSMAENESPTPPPPSRPAPPPIMSGQPAAGTESMFQQNRPAEFLVPRGFTPALDPPRFIPPSQGQQPSSAAPLATLLSSTDATYIAHDEPANDGYNWDMYMQRRVKGCPYPLTYYKCRHADCPALKRIQRAQHGQITDTQYKNTHNHPPPPKPAKDPTHFTPQHVFQSKDCESDTWLVEPESKKRRFE